MAEIENNNKSHNVIFMLTETDNESEYAYYYKDDDSLNVAFDAINKIINGEKAENKVDLVEDKGEN